MHSLSLSRFFCATDAIDVRISTKELDHQRRKREKDSSDGNFVQHFATAQNFIYAVYNSLKFASSPRCIPQCGEMEILVF